MSVPAGAISFKTLQDTALANGFTEINRGDCKNWINFRYGWILGLEEWTFRKSIAAISYTAGTSSVPAPTAFGPGSGVAINLQTADGSQLTPMDWVDFQQRYYGSSIPQGAPEAYTVTSGLVNGTFGPQILLGPTPSSSGTGQLQYLLGVCHLDSTGAVQAGPMSADTDYPILPPEHHLALVHGAKATGFRLTNVPMAAQLEEDFKNTLAAMRANYLEDIRASTGSAPLDQIAYG